MKIAIIGAGISGLSAAYLLHRYHDITVYEQEDYPGGHSRTLSVGLGGDTVAVDTGFIVFNYRNYPHLSALFDHLNVPVTKSSMSFGVSIDNGWLEYGTEHLSGLWAQGQNFWRADFWQMLWHIRRFNGQAKGYVKAHPQATIQEMIDALGLSEWFSRYYLLAMAGSIWSVSRAQIRDFPAQTLINFYDNHGLLTVNDQPQWYTVVGGSQAYVKRLIAGFRQHIRFGNAARVVQRLGEGVCVHDTQGNSERYDRVIMACHSDQALRLLDTPTSREQQVLGAIGYQENTVVLHRDTSLMPKRRRAWASWVYLSQTRDETENRASLSYWMNNLQPLNTDVPILITLNPHQTIDPALVFNRHTFAHPVFTQAAIEAQDRVSELQGDGSIWYCGAWQRYGFHEDGIGSAVKVAQQFGLDIPWLR